MINRSTMPTELNRIRELSGLQQEAPAVGLTAQQKQGLDAINAKYGKYIGYGNGGSLPVEAMERAIDPGSTLWADDKEENELKAYMKKMGYKDLSDMESKDEEYVDNAKLPISDTMADDLQKVLGDYHDNTGLAQAAKEYLESLGESAVAEAPSTDINKSTMPSELDRIRELSGLQQEAAVSLKGKESALKAWYNKYSKYTGGNGDPLPFGLIKAYTESGIISDGYEENELAKAEKALGKKEMDWEDQDWQKVYSMTPITQGMEKDLLTATGSKTVDEELLAKVYDVIEDMYPSYDQVLGKKESAVAEAPASGDQALAKDLANHFMKKANSFKSRGDTGPEYEEMVDIAKAFQQGQDQGMEEINDLANFEFSAHPFGGKFSNNEGEPEDEVLAILNKHGYSFTEKSHPERPNRGLVTLIKKDANTSKISQLAAQPVNSSVDDTIQRARAQIETLESALKEDYKKFQGMKPYKPKKK